MVQNTRVKRALSRKQVGVTPVSNTGIKPHTGDPHQFNTSIDPTKLHKGMEEAATFQMPIELRQLFVDICCHCQPTNALLLFNNNLPHLIEDFVKRGHQAEVAKNLALKWIQDKILQNGAIYENFQLPIPDFELINRLIEAEREENDENIRKQI